MAKATVAQLEKRVDANSALVRAVVDKIDVVMERQLEDRAALAAHLESDKELRKYLSNGFNRDVARIAADEAAKVFAEAQQGQWEREREERRLELEEQKVHNEAMGKQKDRVNRLMISAVPIFSGVIMWLVNKLG